ncbi:MAG: hypothetical protein R2883_03650 [Caldisericia bacterium]
MRKILSFVLTFLLIFTSFVIYPAANAGNAVSGSDCFPTYKANNFRDGVYSGTQINAPELIQTWEYKGKANLTNARLFVETESILQKTAG